MLNHHFSLRALENKFSGKHLDVGYLLIKLWWCASKGGEEIFFWKKSRENFLEVVIRTYLFVENYFNDRLKKLSLKEIMKMCFARNYDYLFRKNKNVFWKEI